MTPAERSKPILEARWRTDGKWLIRLPSGSVRVCASPRAVLALVAKEAMGASVRFIGEGDQ